MEKIFLSTTASEAQLNMINFIYAKIHKQMGIRASFKKTSLRFAAFELIDDEDYDVIITAIIRRLDGCSVKRIGHKCIEISWKPDVMPKLTGRDLVHAGYTQYDQFKEIFDKLRLAILEKRVNNDTVQANLIWVKENFPNGSSKV
jgi:hypothetical protein